MKFSTYQELLLVTERHKVSIGEVALQVELVRTEKSRADLLGQMDQIFQVMESAADEGIKNTEKSLSGLSGGDGARMKGRVHQVVDPLMADAVAMGLGVNETSASQGKIVACPTAGSCGILPGALIAFSRHKKIPREKVLMALFTAGAIGQIIENNACVSGAEGGCQAECGSAAAMAAGAVVELAGGTPSEVVQAATLGLKNLLGLACDPVAGLVEVPCVKRNGILAGFALIAAEMALSGIKSAIPPDEVVEAMYRIGQGMSTSIRETAEGGLAVTPTGLKWKEKIQGSFE